MKRPTKEDFINRSNEMHNFKYDYSKSNYISTRSKVEIICNTHGSFFQRASAHYLGQGCSKCGNSRFEERLKSFISKSMKKHNNKYDYSLVDYKGSRKLVKIICPIHGVFKQKANLHIYGCGCRKCGYTSPRSVNTNPRKRNTFEQWIEKCNRIHNFKYDYSMFNEILSDRNQKVPVICDNGHLFHQTIHDHLGGNGCKFCAFPCFDTESFIRLSKEKHGDKYDYSKSEYKTQKDKIIIICPQHGEFLQKAANHYHLVRGCSRCRESKGEIKIRKWLQDKEIKFTRNKTFERCVNLNKLQYDFYLEELNICIEFDGLQHYKPIKQFGGIEEFKKVQKRDQIKNEFCSMSGMKLIRIGYKNLNKVEEILDLQIVSLLKEI